MNGPAAPPQPGKGAQSPGGWARSHKEIVIGGGVLAAGALVLYLRSRSSSSTAGSSTTTAADTTTPAGTVTYAGSGAGYDSLEAQIAALQQQISAQQAQTPQGPHPPGHHGRKPPPRKHNPQPPPGHKPVRRPRRRLRRPGPVRKKG